VIERDPSSLNRINDESSDLVDWERDADTGLCEAEIDTVKSFRFDLIQERHGRSRICQKPYSRFMIATADRFLCRSRIEKQKRYLCVVDLACPTQDTIRRFYISERIPYAHVSYLSKSYG